MEGRQVSEQPSHLKNTAAGGYEGEEIQRQNPQEHLRLSVVTGINLSPASFLRYKLLLSLSNLAMFHPINRDGPACFLNYSLSSPQIDMGKLQFTENNT